MMKPAILDFRRGEKDIFTLPGWYTA